MHVKKNLTLNCKSLSTGCQKMTSLQKMIRWPEPLNFSFRWFCCSTFCIWSIFWNTSFWERRVWIARVLPPLTKYKTSFVDQFKVQEYSPLQSTLAPYHYSMIGRLNTMKLQYLSMSTCAVVHYIRQILKLTVLWNTKQNWFRFLSVTIVRGRTKVAI